VLTALDKRENCCRNKNTRPPLLSVGEAGRRTLLPLHDLLLRIHGSEVSLYLDASIIRCNWMGGRQTVALLHLSLVGTAKQRCTMIGACS
jgi:hypothetical protein